MATPPVRLQNDDDLLTQVRSVTDYSDAVLSDTDFKEVVATAKAEIMAEAGNTSLSFYGDIDEERALFWTTCLFAKIRAGEVEGVPMSLGDIELETVRAQSEYGGVEALWLQNARKYIDRVVTAQSNTARFAIRSISRSGDRSYGGDDSTTLGGN